MGKLLYKLKENPEIHYNLMVRHSTFEIQKKDPWIDDYYWAKIVEFDDINAIGQRVLIYKDDFERVV